MERRALLQRLIVGLPLAGTLVAGAAVRTAGSVRETSDQSLEICKRQLEALRERVDRSDARAKKTLKVVLAVTALSLGMDISMLL